MYNFSAQAKEFIRENTGVPVMTRLGVDELNAVLADHIAYLLPVIEVEFASKTHGHPHYIAIFNQLPQKAFFSYTQIYLMTSLSQSPT
jgi:hypothetical protein